MEQDMQLHGERISEMVEVNVTPVAPEGLGFGEGSISLKARLEELGEETMQKVDKLVSSSEILVPVSLDKNGKRVDDDGCGDGRNVAQVFEGEQPRNKSLNRAKVFGGGVTMAAATRIGLGKAEGVTLRQVFSEGLASLQDKLIDFGAHTDTHAHGESCGCGAIDKAPVIVANAVKYQAQIRASIVALGIDTDGLEEVEGAFATYAETDLGEYSGRSVMGEIIRNAKIVKQLDDNHKETVVVLNAVEGYTVDQEKVREVSDGKAQAFAVDIWRVKQLADRLYADQSEDVRQKAFLSELTYTLATAATLTAGDLPVYVVDRQPEAIVA